jgi:hypothetical protein
MAACGRSGWLLETWCLMEYAEKGTLADLVHKGRLKRPDGRSCDLFSAIACLTDIASGARLLGRLTWQLSLVLPTA